MIVLPTADAPGAICVAERIRVAFEAKPVTTERDKIAITVSLGVAVSSPTNSFDPEALLQMADESLYRAKQTGRNRVELAPVPEREVTVLSDDSRPSDRAIDQTIEAESR